MTATATHADAIAAAAVFRANLITALTETSQAGLSLCRKASAGEIDDCYLAEVEQFIQVMLTFGTGLELMIEGLTNVIDGFGDLPGLPASDSAVAATN